MKRDRSWIDVPSPFDTSATWQRHLEIVTALPRTHSARPSLIREAKRMLAWKRQAEKDPQNEKRLRSSFAR